MSSETTYTVRFYGGPKDGAEEQISEYPPANLHGYGLAYSKVGRFYMYSWTRAAREKQGGAR